MLLNSWIEKIKIINNEKLVVHFCRLIGNIINYENGKINKKVLSELVNNKLTDDVVQIVDNPEGFSENTKDEIKMMKLYLVRYFIRIDTYNDSKNSFDVEFKYYFNKFIKKYNSDA
jgi:hypothetical protein